eukprot:Hpha_TRINITY_DN7364_c0_g1::TRINITY_DN7364_c0_g1_i1::g.9971::m.9971
MTAGAGGGSMSLVYCQVSKRLTIVSHANGRKVVEDPSKPLANFECFKEPTLSLPGFMEWLRQSVHVTDAEWVHTLVLVDRLLCRQDGHLTKMNAHRLVITGLAVVLKLQRESCGVLPELARISRLSDMAGMERVFLNAIEWDVNVPKAQFEDVLGDIPCIHNAPTHRLLPPVVRDPLLKRDGPLFRKSGLHRLRSIIRQRKHVPTPPGHPSTARPVPHLPRLLSRFLDRLIVTHH